MKRTTKNEKVIRAITIGLATMIAATSAPVNVLADESEGSSSESSEATNSGSEEKSEQTETVEESVDTVEDTVEAVEKLSDSDEYKEIQDKTVKSDTGAVIDSVSENLSVAADPNQTPDSSQVSAPVQAQAPGETSDAPVEKDQLEIIANSLSGLDNAFNNANSEINGFNEMVAADGAAGLAVGYADNLTGEAAGAVDNAANTASDSLVTVNEQKDEVVAAASTEYTSQPAADNAKAEAGVTLGNAKRELSAAQTVSGTAQDKLKESEDALDAADKAVKEASEKKEKADKAVNEAKEAYIKVLDDNGISYNVDEDGNITIDEKAEITDGHIKTAVDYAQKAVDEAVKFAGDAATALNGKIEAVETAAKGLVKQTEKAEEEAESKKTEKEKAFNDSFGSRKDTLESVLAEIKKCQKEVNEAVSNKKTQDYYVANRKLTYLITKYTLIQDQNVDPNSVNVVQDKNGEIKRNNDKSITIKYKMVGSKEEQSINLMYTGVRSDGDPTNYNELIDADHIVVHYTNGTMYANEAFINAGTDAYQSMKREVADATSAQNKATADREHAEAILANYADLEKATSNREAITTELDAAKADLKQYLGQYGEDKQKQLDNLLKEISAQQEVLKGSDTTTGNFFERCRVLAARLLEYKLAQEGYLTSFEVETKDNKINWYTGNGTRNNYGVVTYTLNGENKTAYFDYTVYYENGEIMGITAYNKKEDSTLNPNKKDSSLKVDHIRVVEKTPISTNSKGIVFANKGETAIDEAEFNAGNDTYKKLISRIASLTQDLETADTAVATAQMIKDLGDSKSIADKLSIKANAAKKAVDEAADALKKARQFQSLDTALLDKLTKQLADAKKEYETAKSDLDKANADVVRIQSVVDEIEAAIRDGFKFTADTTDGSDDDDADDTTAAAVSDGATSDGADYTVSAPVYGTDYTTTAAPGAFDDAGTFGDAGVLGARVPEGGSTGGDANGAGLENNGGIAPVANFNTVKKVLGAKTPVVGKKNNKKGVRVADPVTPLAAMPEEDGFSMNWWWLLVIALLGATGKKMYDEHKKKVEAREQARNNTND